jgi:hypothetical protein
MKNNSKNRRLNFIRQKNNLRLGRTKFYVVEKTHDDIVTDYYIRRLIEKAKKALLKHYKLSFRNPKIVFEREYCDDDFVKDIKTNRVAISLK